MLVSFEGIDGSGKSTAARAVARRLRARGLSVRVTQEPTTTWLGRAVRRGIRNHLDPLALCGLFLADRALHVASIWPESVRGRVVITDRYTDSTTAYQGAALDRRLPAAMEVLDRFQALAFPRPDVVILLDLPVPTALSRLRHRRVREPFERARFLKRVRANYLRLARRNARRWRILDARRPARRIADEAAEFILERLEKSARA